MRQARPLDRAQPSAAARHHGDGHAVMLRALPDYDALFGVDFTSTPTAGNRRGRPGGRPHDRDTTPPRRRARPEGLPRCWPT